MTKKKNRKRTKKQKKSGSVVASKQKRTVSKKRAVKQTAPRIKRPFLAFWIQSWIPALLLLIASLALYLQTIPYEYVLDDQIVITGNNYTKKGFSGIRDILTTETFQGYFGEQKDLLPGSRYRPLSVVTFAIENGLFGLDARVSHFLNAFLYALAVLLVFRVLSLLMPRRQEQPWFWGLAFVTTALFALHPLHTEAVANVKGRDEIMAMIGAMGAFYYVIRYSESRQIVWYLASGMAFFLGLLSKENTITFLAIIPAGLYFFRKATFRHLLWTSLPLILATVAYLVIRYNVIGYLFSSGTQMNDLMNNPFLDMSTSEKSATIMYTLGLYLKLSFFPHPLTHDYYPFHIPTMQWSNFGSWFSLLLYIALAIWAILGIRRRRPASFAILMYLAPLTVVSNIFFTVGTFMNERFVFMSSLGICLLLGLLLTRWLYRDRPPWLKYVAYALGALYAIGFIYQSLQRIPVWRSPLTLNQAAVKVSKNSARANTFMGTALFNTYKASTDPDEQRRLLREASYYITRATELYPRYYNANLMKAGVAAENFKFRRDIDALLTEFRTIATVRPDIGYLHEYYDYLNSQGYDSSKLTDFYYDIGYNHLFKNDHKYTWAVKYLNYAKSLSPEQPRIYSALSECYRALGDAQNAGYFAQRARELQ